MNKERFAERMLETENLTDALEDADANWLLNWGTGKLDTVLSGIQDDAAAGERANALMALMRKMNRIAGSYSEKSPEALAEDLAALRELAAAAFGASEAPVVPEAPAAPMATRSGRGPLVDEPDKLAEPAGGVGEQRLRPAETGFRPLRSLVNWFRRWRPQAEKQPEGEETPAFEVKAEPVTQPPDLSTEAEKQPDLAEAERQPDFSAEAEKQPDLAEAARLGALSPGDVLKELSKLVGES